MAATTAICSTFKRELLEAGHNFKLTGGNTFKLALIIPAMAGTYGASSTNYSNITGNSDECPATGGYATGGATLTRIDPALSGSTAVVDFADVVYSAATISARACMIYNSTLSNAAVSVHDFGATISSTNGNFTITFPTADAANAIIRIA